MTRTDFPVTMARSAIFPANPGAITVAIDAGHGGGDPGAVRPGLYEKTANLDIALRLRAMLVGAGVNVVMTRTTDRKVNTAQVDWTGDGKVDYRDELAARIEVANAARADCLRGDPQQRHALRGRRHRDVVQPGPAVQRRSTGRSRPSSSDP